jgi:hypothetical protein
MEQTIEQLLKLVKVKMSSHNEYKELYNSKLAFDFNILNFFNVGENKISEFLAFLLDPNSDHGQGYKFLDLFVLQFLSGKGIDPGSFKHVKCEKILPSERRIDLWLEFDSFVLAIENKIWADDQKNQLFDYSKYLEEQTHGKYQLLYLTPYGVEPSLNSISKLEREGLLNVKKLKLISYEYDIIGFLNSCVGLCEAGSVTYFIKEVVKFIQRKIYRDNQLNMANVLKEIILSNKDEVYEIVNVYNQLTNGLVKQLNDVGEAIGKKSINVLPGVNYKYIRPFNYDSRRVFKVELETRGQKVFVGLNQHGFEIQAHFHFDQKNDNKFNDFISGKYNFKDRTPLNISDNGDLVELKTSKLVEHFVSELMKFDNLLNEFYNKHN